MPTASTALTMPGGLEDFPWIDLLYMWDYVHLSTSPRLVLYYPPEADTVLAQAESAWSVHSDVWRWLESRRLLAEVPTFEASGRAFAVDGAQMYSGVRFEGTFVLSPSSLASRSL